MRENMLATRSQPPRTRSSAKTQAGLPQTFDHSGWHIKYNLLHARSQASSASPSSIVVFVHGTAWSSKVFRPLAEATAATCGSDILLYDLAGYGESQQRDEADNSTTPDSNGFVGDTSVRAQAEILSALLAHLQLDVKSGGHRRPAVIAHDIAGAIALRAHLLHGCEFERLMLLDTNAVLPWGDSFYKLVRSNPQVFLQMPASIYEAVVRAAIRSACYTSRGRDPAWEDQLAEPWLDRAQAKEHAHDQWQRSFVRQIAQANDADVAEMLERSLYKDVRCRVKILWGEEDSWIPREKMDRLASMMRHCLDGFVVVPEAGHLLMLDQPERVTAEIVSWLTNSRS